MRYALIRNGIVENVILWDGVTNWEPGDGLVAIPCPDWVSIGWSRSHDGAWSPPGEDAEAGDGEHQE